MLNQGEREEKRGEGRLHIIFGKEHMWQREAKPDLTGSPLCGLRRRRRPCAYPKDDQIVHQADGEGGRRYRKAKSAESEIKKSKNVS
jgi:hypothetical protein